jgi:hypothetical protein
MEARLEEPRSRRTVSPPPPQCNQHWWFKNRVVLTLVWALSVFLGTVIITIVSGDQTENSSGTQQAQSPRPSPGQIPRPGCMIHDEVVQAIAGISKPIDVSVTYLGCLPSSSAGISEYDAFLLTQLKNKYGMTDFGEDDLRKMRLLYSNLVSQNRQSEALELRLDYNRIQRIVSTRDAEQKVKSEVLVGGRARLRLLSPLSPVEIKPISEEIQDIKGPGDEATGRGMYVRTSLATTSYLLSSAC